MILVGAQLVRMLEVMIFGRQKSWGADMGRERIEATEIMKWWMWGRRHGS